MKAYFIVFLCMYLPASEQPGDPTYYKPKLAPLHIPRSSHWSSVVIASDLESPEGEPDSPAPSQTMVIRIEQADERARHQAQALQLYWQLMAEERLQKGEE